LVVCCLLALVVAGGLVPAISSGIADSPAESLLPGEPPGEGQTAAMNGGSGESGFGALNPGRTTDIGGATGVDNPFRSQDTEVHFTATSSQPAYWRTGAYDRYTGSGWEQTGGREPLTGPISGDGIQGTRVEYEVSLNRTASALPTVWRPTTITGRSDLAVSDQRAVHAVDALEPGESYVGVSHRPPQDPAVLNTAGGDYPPEIVQRYATLPDDVPERVGSLAADLTSQDETAYEKASSIEQWLETSKEYSLNVSRTSDSMTDTFLFEMERGYCEYFASSMVVLLRTQGIPARYTVGYSTGEQSGNDYTVRAMNAHAWVEVYFEDVGWVKFDPTPGRARLQQEQQTLQQQTPQTSYTTEEQGSPGETFSPTDESTPTATPNEPNTVTDAENTTDSVPEQTDTGYDISLNRTAVPGAVVDVSVTSDGSPATGVTVLFNGESVGVTDARGRVTATVPYAETLRIGIDDGTTASLDAPGSVPVAGDRVYSVPEPTATADVTVPVETNATLTVTGERVPGNTVTVTATVSDLPVTNAAITVDGDQVGTTNDDGRARVTLPDSPGTVAIAVEREPISAVTQIRLPDLNVSVTPSLPLALPLTGATVTATADGGAVRGAPVSVGGKQVGTTDGNGTATVGLPLASSTTVAVQSLGQRETATIAGLFVNLGLTLGALAVGVGAVLVAAARRGYTPRVVAAIIRRLPGLVVEYARWLLVVLATQGDRLFARLLSRLRRSVRMVVDVLRGRASPQTVWAALLAWLNAQRARLSNRVGSDSDGRPSEPTSAESKRTIRAAWARFLDHVSIPDKRTKTPGEIARHAVASDGLPASPVRLLRDTFREVEYGTRSGADRLDRVESALSEIERAATEPDTDETETDGGAE
jgi:transglutaminase-like putative cysteine protease